MIKGFEPIVAIKPKILILGSMPSISSLSKNEYYGFKHNRFWKVMEQYFNVSFNTYEDKIACIKNNHVVLWDVIFSCEREGSLDSNIKNEKLNDIETLISINKSIKVVICNGKKSYDLYCKAFPNLKIECCSLPSTSNANRTIKETELFEQWFHMLDKYLK